MNQKTITNPLKYPVTVDSEKFTKITLREPDVDALEAIDELGLQENTKPKIRDMRVMIVALSDLPDKAVGKLHRDDFTEIAEMIAPLLGDEEQAASSIS